MNTLEKYQKVQEHVKKLQKYLGVAEQLLEKQISGDDYAAVEDYQDLLEVDFNYQQETLDRLIADVALDVVKEKAGTKIEQVDSEEMKLFKRKIHSPIDEMLGEIYKSLDELNERYKE